MDNRQHETSTLPNNFQIVLAQLNFVMAQTLDFKTKQEGNLQLLQHDKPYSAEQRAAIHSQKKLISTIDIHLQLLSGQLEKVSTANLSTTIACVETIINQHDRWCVIISKSPPAAIKERKDYRFTDIYNESSEPHLDKVATYLSDWQSIIDAMPEDLMERQALLINLEQHKTELLKLQIPTYKTAEILTTMNAFEAKMDKEYGALLHIIGTPLEVVQLKAAARERMRQWNGLLEDAKKDARHDPTDRVKFKRWEPRWARAAQTIELLNDAIQTNNVEKIQNALNELNMPYMSKINRRIEEPSAAATKQTIVIRAKTQTLETEIAAKVAKGKKIPDYMNAKLTTLKATIEYLENERSKESLDQVLEKNPAYDKASFARSQTKNLIIDACKVKGDEFIDPKANKKLKQEAAPVTSIKPSTRSK